MSPINHAVLILVKATILDEPEAQHDLGVCYTKGEGVVKSDSHAFYWYKRSAEKNILSAKYNVAQSYYRGYGVKIDNEEAIKWFEESAMGGHIKSILELAYIHIKIDQKKGYKLFRVAADENNSDGQYNVGLCYKYGEGVTKNVKEATKWFLLAANNDHTLAQVQLGEIYMLGIECKMNTAEGIKWYTKASDNGSTVAKVVLASCYGLGTGVKVNKYKANELIKYAEENCKDDMTKLLLSMCYKNGFGIQVNKEKAEKYVSSVNKSNPILTGLYNNFLSRYEKNI
jgi:hypothetical protein